MKFPTSHAPQGDARLWGISLMLSVLVNLALLLCGGFLALKSQKFRQSRPPPVTPPAAAETSVVILPEVVASIVASAAAPPPPPAAAATSKPRFARTSEDQTAPPPEQKSLIGERNTRATSDRAPTAAAPPLPSQAGVSPKSAADLETTQSTYQDGKSAPPAEKSPDAAAAPSLPKPPPATEPPPLSPKSKPAEKLLSGPDPVDVSIPAKPPESPPAPLIPEKPPAEKPVPPEPPTPPSPPKPKPAANDPAFRGNQKKTAIVGSISRTGRSALDVADSPLGRYQALVSRAVEQEWQRNCVRHRDFITPGFLTLRFFVEPSGKVRSVQFVGEMQTGEVQKGFTLNAIRDAPIPPMPAALKKDFSKEPLELVFNFYF